MADVIVCFLQFWRTTELDSASQHGPHPLRQWRRHPEHPAAGFPSIRYSVRETHRHIQLFLLHKVDFEDEPRASKEEKEERERRRSWM